MLVLAILAVAQDASIPQTVRCEAGLDLAESACLSAYNITDSRYCVLSGSECLSVYRLYQFSCNLLNRPSRSYTDLRDWNATFPEDSLAVEIMACTYLSPDAYEEDPDAYEEIAAACSQLCVASDDSEDDNQIGLILGLSLGLGLPAFGVLIYFLVIRPNQKKNGTKNTVDTQPLM